MGHLAFFIRHSLSNMNHNRQRTALVLLSIAAGVAAIVSMQTLGLMVGDSLTGNLQARNRGDIVVTIPVATTASGNTYDEALVDAGTGMFSANSFSQVGVERIRTWAKGRGYEMTAVSRGASPIRLPQTATGQRRASHRRASQRDLWRGGHLYNRGSLGAEPYPE